MPHPPQEFHQKMAVDHLKFGAFGERKAVKFLKKNGYKIVERNYKCPFGEVDIIAQKGEVLAFIEVKSRHGDDFGKPAQAVDAERRARYVRSAKYYFSGRTIDVVVRFDIIEFLNGEINHIENAF